MVKSYATKSAPACVNVIGSASVKDQPASLNGHLDSGAVLGRRTLQIIKEWPVDQLNEDSSVLDSFNRVGDFDKLAGRGFRIGVGAFGGVFHLRRLPLIGLLVIGARFVAGICPFSSDSTKPYPRLTCWLFASFLSPL